MRRLPRLGAPPRPVPWATCPGPRHRFGQSVL